MKQAGSLSEAPALLGRRLLIGILIAALAALHVLSADGDFNLSAGESVTSAARSLGHSAARSGQERVSAGGAHTTALTTAAEATVTSTGSPSGAGTGVHLQCSGPGDCVLFPAAGLAPVVLLMACTTTRALRCRDLIVVRWVRAVVLIAARRGPPLRRRPRIALCVMRV